MEGQAGIVIEEMVDVLRPLVDKHMVSSIALTLVLRGENGTDESSWWSGSLPEALGLLDSMQYRMRRMSYENFERGE